MAAQILEVIDAPLYCNDENTGLQSLTDLHNSKFRDYDKVGLGMPLSACLSHTSFLSFFLY
jgi:hypothetical protein